MGMKHLSTIGKGLKIALYVGLAAYVANILLSLYYGYYSIDARYGGAFFYNWRMKFVDKKISKSAYAANKLSEQKPSELFSYYLEKVQLKGDKEKNEWPYYAYGLPDTFVLDPKRTWTIFSSRDNPNFEADKKKMDLDFEFLEMRAKLIRKMHPSGTKYDPKSYFFEENIPKINKETATKEELTENSKLKAKMFDPILTEKFFKMMDKKDVQEFFEKNDFRGINKDFNEIISKLVKGEKDYSVELTKDSAKMTSKFSTDIMKIVKKVFKGFEVSESDVNDFFYRIATVTPTPMDVHILNRAYFYFLYNFSYLDIEKFEDAEYNKLKEEYKVVLENIKNFTGPDVSALERKRDVKLKKMHDRRTVLIFNEFTNLIASVLGTQGPVIKNDERNFLEAFGNPGTMKEAKKTVFRDQIAKAY